MINTLYLQVHKTMFESLLLHYDHINSFTKYLLIIFYVPHTVLGTRDPTEDKTDKTSAVIFQCRRGGMEWEKTA